MTLGKLLKWISVVLSNFIVIFLLGKFLSDYAVTGFVLGVLWMYIAINIIGDRIPRDKLDEWKKFKNNK